MTRITCLIFLLTTILFAESDFEKSRKALSSDSLNISRIMWRIKDPKVKNRLHDLLDDLNLEMKLLTPYRINKYSRKKHSYTLTDSAYMPVDILLDSLKNIIDKSVVISTQREDLTINKKTDLYKNLNVYPEYKDKNYLRSMLYETILNSDKKRTIEWIWGRSIDDDAFFSTKLMAYDGIFLLYPEFRRFIGRDSFRNKNSWFFDLQIYDPSKKDIKELIVEKTSEKIIVEKKKNIITVTPEEIKPELIIKNEDNYKTIDFDLSLDTLLFNINFFDQKNGEKNYSLVYSKKMSIKKLINSQIKSLSRAKFIKLNRTRINNHSKSEEYIALNENFYKNLKENENKLKEILTEVYNNPDKKSTIEWIVGRGKKGYSYYAVVFTAYDGQLTIFNDYKKSTNSSYYNDKTSWYNKLGYYVP